MTDFVEFYTFKLSTPSSSPPFLTPLKSTQGLQALYFGNHLESPGTYTLILHWTSPEAHKARTSTASFPAWQTEYKAAVQNDSLAQAHMRGNPRAALDAPCTEILMAYGVEDGFFGKCTEFIEKVDGGLGLNDGYRGYAVGETVGEIAKVDMDGVEGEKGKGVVMVLGWDSKEAHVEAKSKPGPIGENIHLIRSGRKDVSLCHVNLAKLT